MTQEKPRITRTQFCLLSSLVGVQIASSETGGGEEMSDRPLNPALGATGARTWINLQDFGAVGDGSRDDTAAVAKALRALPDEGGWLIVPPGRYMVRRGALRCEKRVHIIGAGMGSSVFVMTSGPGVCLTIEAPWSSVSNVGFLYGSQQFVGDSVGLWVKHRDFTQLEKVQIQGFGVSARVTDGIYFTIRDCSFRDFGTGLELSYEAASDAGDSVVEGCTFDRTTDSVTRGGTAVLWRSGGGLRFTNNKINGRPTRQGALQYGVRLTPSAVTRTGLVIVSGNSIECFTSSGISLAPDVTGAFFNSLIIVGNEIAGYDAHQQTAVSVDDVTDGVVLSGNHIYDVHRGIYVNKAKNISIGPDNVLSRIRGVGVELGAQAHSAAVAGAIGCQPGGADVIVASQISTPISYGRNSSLQGVADGRDNVIFRVVCSAVPAVADVEVAATNHGDSSGFITARLILSTGARPEISAVSTPASFAGASITCVRESSGLFRIGLVKRRGDTMDAVVRWTLSGGWNTVMSAVE